MLVINDKIIKQKQFAYDGCHKIYLLKNKNEIEEAKSKGYIILGVQELVQVYMRSCPLKFIESWDLKEVYSEQFENPKFRRK